MGCPVACGEEANDCIKSSCATCADDALLQESVHSAAAQQAGAQAAGAVLPGLAPPNWAAMTDSERREYQQHYSSQVLPLDDAVTELSGSHWQAMRQPCVCVSWPSA